MPAKTDRFELVQIKVTESSMGTRTERVHQIFDRPIAAICELARLSGYHGLMYEFPQDPEDAKSWNYSTVAVGYYPETDPILDAVVLVRLYREPRTN